MAFCSHFLALQVPTCLFLKGDFEVLQQIQVYLAWPERPVHPASLLLYLIPLLQQQAPGLLGDFLIRLGEHSFFCLEYFSSALGKLPSD